MFLQQEKHANATVLAPIFNKDRCETPVPTSVGALVDDAVDSIEVFIVLTSGIT